MPVVSPYSRVRCVPFYCSVPAFHDFDCTLILYHSIVKTSRRVRTCAVFN